MIHDDITFGDSALLIATSLKDKWTLGSYLFSSSTVISPDLQKEKNVTRAAAPQHNRVEGLVPAKPALPHLPQDQWSDK